MASRVGSAFPENDHVGLDETGIIIRTYQRGEAGRTGPDRQTTYRAAAVLTAPQLASVRCSLALSLLKG